MKYVFCAIIALSLMVGGALYFVEGRGAGDEMLWQHAPPAKVTVVETPPQTSPGWPPGIPNPLENRPPLPTTPNLALGKPTEAGTQVRDHISANTVDGSPNTFWESARLPVMLTIDLEDIYTVQSVALALNPQWDMRSQVFEILTSVNGEDFEVALESDVHLFTPRTANTVRMDFAPVNAQYVRFIFTANTALGVNGAQVAEVMVFE
ncbi:MAG: discoidin domain-containing protein [Defluviitaleaceae bacterium]|nr:discoidin domain-containing protein [Defluviitaleaceae bacterium]